MTTTSTLTAPTTLPSRLALVGEAVEADTVNLQVEIELLQLAFLGKLHVFFLSPPGAAKSYLINRFLAYISGAKLFHYLMFRMSTDADLYGPQAVTKMLEDRNVRAIEGYLPWADIGVLEEGFKASPSVLNALLELANERRFRNDGVKIDVPLSTLLIASNEMPEKESDELAAFYDRIHIRRVVKPVSDRDDIVKMLGLRADPNPTPIMTWSEMVTAQAEVADMPINPAVYGALADIVVELAVNHKIVLSGRRTVSCLQLVRAKAWLDGASEAGVEHMEPLIHMLWERPEQAAAVEGVVLRISAPGVKDVLDLADVVTGIAEDVADASNMESGSTERETAAITARAHLRRCAGDAIALEAVAVGPAARKLAELVDRMEAVNLATWKVISPGLTTGFPLLFDEVRASLASV